MGAWSPLSRGAGSRDISRDIGLRCAGTIRDHIGLGLTVFVGVKIEGHANDKAMAFEEAVVAFPEVVACPWLQVKPTI